MMADPVQEMLHKIDQKATGRIVLPEEVTNPETRDRYIMNSLIEEAITSSQMEGASTTRAIASEMIRSGRPPTDRSEQMIANNYIAIKRIHEIVKDELTPHKVLELHETLTEDTLDNPESAGKLQTPDDVRVSVVDNASNRVLYVPPPAEQLPARLKMMCDFANGKSRTDFFIHPIIRSIILHFWLAHDHPFEDGNGRTARALFYWSMLSNEYWLFEYVSISTILKKAFSQYGTSYLYAESDENDLTYFIIFQLEVMVKAIAALEQYLERKVAQIKDVEAKLRRGSNFNHRQMALLGHALRHPRAEYTIKSHRRSHNVAYATASSDLMALAKAGLLDHRRSGQKTHIFIAPGDMQQRIESFES
jgi:Fic family protein